MKNAFCAALCLLFAAALSLHGEEAPVLSVSAAGSSSHSLERHLAVYNDSVVVTYGGLRLECARLEIRFAEDNRTPRSFRALAALPSAAPKERAKARLVLKSPGKELRCSELTVSFHPQSTAVASVEAKGDVWANLAEEGFVVHCDSMTIESPPEGKDFTAFLRTGAGVQRVEIAGEGFAAREGNSTLARKGEELLHEGRDVDVFFDVKEGRTILPADVAELRASRLNIRAAAFRFEPNRHSFRFSGGAELVFGALGIRAANIRLLTDKTNRLPVSLSAEGEPAAMRWKGMALDSPAIAFTFSKKGELARFSASGKTSVRVTDSSGRRLEAECSSAVWEADRIVMTGEPDVVIRIPSQKLKLTERKSEFFLREGRWEHRGEGSRTEIDR